MKWQSLLLLGVLASQTIAGTDTIDCDIDADKCDVGKALSGAKYLRGLSGQPIARAGKCNRVSCSWGAGIYVCSNDNKDHTLKSWETVADVTEKVLGRCVDATQVKGRLSSSDGWGVIVQKAAC
ncbi:hypothetical protein ASPSYDRAFT_137860 [Aspergillus sydowii CBS 593.65]|uniref:Ecp2 effector protein domain-containing protein n=1 Tax=Aspergillus sydowii CBS 593.65 TaxID=1036612 RepID=A0A1L9SYT9_9EURO|nr:uncharacterized protein ASPSYDRAFT_137860 [Aspergillus sydowii CBS 593.65]OJJ52348.1 hypothetical protein ASPSYDRAFT_137860 [Aspergillus sydowii CBS 593.65]